MILPWKTYELHSTVLSQLKFLSHFCFVTKISIQEQVADLDYGLNGLIWVFLIIQLLENQTNSLFYTDDVYRRKASERQHQRRLEDASEVGLQQPIKWLWGQPLPLSPWTVQHFGSSAAGLLADTHSSRSASQGLHSVGLSAQILTSSLWENTASYNTGPVNLTHQVNTKEIKGSACFLVWW